MVTNEHVAVFHLGLRILTSGAEGLLDAVPLSRHILMASFRDDKVVIDVFIYMSKESPTNSSHLARPGWRKRAKSNMLVMTALSARWA